MKCILISAPSSFLTDDKTDPPLGLLYLASYALSKIKDLEIEIIDLTGNCDWKSKVKNLQCDLIGVSCTSPQFNIVKEIIDFIKENNLNVPIVIGGPHPTSMPEQTLQETKADFIVMDEGEVTFVELLINLGKDYAQIKGMGYKNNGKISVNEKRQRIRDIDSIPFPARHLINLDDYSFNVLGFRSTTLMTSRGCPYQCAFCDKDIWGRDARLRSAKNVLDEVDELVKKYKYEYLYFFDDNFTTNRKRLKEMCDGLKERKLKWKCRSRASTVNEESIKWMKESGCIEIGYGIESGSQKILDKMNKKTTVKQNIKAIQLTREAGIFCRIFLIIGFPFEDKVSVEKTKRMLKKAKPDKVLLCTFVPLIGSEVWKYPEKFDITYIDKDLSNHFIVGKNMDGGGCFETKYMTKQQLIDAREKFKDFLKEKGMI